MEQKKFSVFEAVSYGIKESVDNFRLFFFVSLSYASVIFGAIALGVLAIGLAGFINLKSLLPLAQQELLAGSQMCFPTVLSLILEIKKIFPTTSLFFIGVIAGVFIYAFSIGLMKIALDMYDYGTSSTKTLFIGFKYIPKVFVAHCLYMAMVSMGFLLFVIPGMYLMARFSFFIFFIIDKNSGVVESLRQSYAVTAGNTWHIVSLFSVTMIVASMIKLMGFVFVLPIMMIPYAYAYRALSRPVEPVHAFD